MCGTLKLVFRGRNADGSWIERFEPEEFNFSGGEYTEGWLGNGYGLYHTTSLDCVSFWW